MNIHLPLSCIRESKDFQCPPSLKNGKPSSRNTGYRSPICMARAQRVLPQAPMRLRYAVTYVYEGTQRHKQWP